MLSRVVSNFDGADEADSGTVVDSVDEGHLYFWRESIFHVQSVVQSRR